MARRRRMEHARPTEDATPDTSEKAFLKLARDRFEQAQVADRPQREREREDLRFLVDQWPADIRQSRAAQEAKDGLPPVPARPCLQIDKISAPLQQVLNEERQADLGIELVPADDFGDVAGPMDETEVELREGLIRRIQRDSNASVARLWAADRAAKCGRAYYGIMTRYLPGASWDKEVYIDRKYNQFSVTVDPTHEDPTGADIEWAFEGADMPWDQYKTEFPHVIGKDGKRKRNAVLDTSKADFRALGEDYPNWFTDDKDMRSCRVVNYWYTERTPRSLLQLEDGSSIWEDNAPANAKIIDRRDVIEKKIKWAKIDGSQRLDETDWEGPDIPIIKVMGEELQPYDKERRAEGMVRGGRDAQFAFNAMVSKLMNDIALAPNPTFQASLDHIEGYREWYMAVTTRQLPYLPYNLIGSDGQRLAPPPRTPTDTNISAIAAAISMFDDAIKSTTGKGDPELGHVDPSLKSGKVVESLKRQSQFGTSHFLDNLKRSVAREGEIINRLLYPIYGKPGRLVRIMTSEGESQIVRINPPVASGPALAGGPSLPVAMGAPPPLPGAVGAPGASGGPSVASPPKQYRLTKDANLSVAVKVVQSSTHRREQENAFLAQLPPEILMGWFGDIFFKNQDGPGHLEMAERAKVMLDPKIQASIAAKTNGGAMPPQAMAQIAALQKQLQDAEGLIQKAQQEIQAKQTEWAARAKIAADEREFKGTMDLEFKRTDNETKIAVAELGAKVDRLSLFMEERARLGVQAHEAALETAGAAHDINLSQQEHQQMLEQGAQAAAPQPLPSTSPQADGAGE